MSLTSALLSSQYGIVKAENQLSIASANVSNADKEGYTRKSYQETAYVSVDGTSISYKSSIERSANQYLTDAVNRESTNLGYHSTTDRYMRQYDDSMGSTGGQSSISASLDELVVSIDALEQTPEDTSQQINVIQAADDLAYELNRQSAEIQDLRLQADQEIDNTVDEINALLQELDDYNDAIVDAKARNIPTADLEDERAVALEELSKLMDTQYHEKDNGSIQIYSTGGDLLLGENAKTLEFTSTGNMTGDATYPGALSGITVDGEDITSTIRGGKLGALLDIRDESLVEEQDKLDELATELMDEMNRIHNAGASVPAPNEMTGSTGFATTDSLAGSTGTFRVAVTDADGVVTEFVDIDMTLVNDVNDLINDINAGLVGATASLDANGSLVIEATNNAEGIALSDMGGVDVAGSGQGVSDYFGLNDFFDTGSTGAEDIRVRSDLLDNPEHMSVGALSTDPALVVGDIGVMAGDATTATALSDMFVADQTFDAAGDLVGQNDTFQGYLSSIIASGANKIDDAARNAENAQYEYDAAKETLVNATGVNVDEELTNITVIENAYSSSAQVMATVQEMFDTLLEAMN